MTVEICVGLLNSETVCEEDGVDAVLWILNLPESSKGEKNGKERTAWKRRRR